MINFIMKFLLLVAFVVLVMAGLGLFQGSCTHFGDVVKPGETPPPSQACRCMGFELFTVDESARGGITNSICLGYVAAKFLRPVEPQPDSP